MTTPCLLNGWLVNEEHQPQGSRMTVGVEAVHLLSGVSFLWLESAPGVVFFSGGPDRCVHFHHPALRSRPISGPLDRAGALAFIREVIS